ncbi:EAL domain-containing protein [Ancylobacter sp. A5.8]|uniref:putative bifunctional diguanylate cyclase/phosphodiesterase n=1 Tax=Ancylobacter gelatini TaxID=2919920 RepID=UPI001F4EFB2D|nr:EAL domain-containing protein [Ancylobacter gelatini]MCJ8143702.1 EAL domain-containing protein [Ancylobacter gelatini]
MSKAGRSGYLSGSEPPSGRAVAAPARLIGLNAALDAMSEGFALFDDADRLVVHNRRLEELFPYLGNMQGLTFAEIAAHEMASVPQNALGEIDERQAVLAERLQRHDLADGEPFDVPLAGGGYARVRERRTREGWIVSTWTDISQHKLAERKLLEAIGGISEGFLLLDPGERVLLFNERMAQIFGRAGVSFEAGRRLPDLLRQAAQKGLFAEPINDPEHLIAFMGARLGEAEDRRFEIPLRNGDWMLVSHHRMADGNTVGIWTDVTAQKKRETELVLLRSQLEQQSEALAEFARLIARQARSDLLTGLPNRFALEERLDGVLRDGQTWRIWVGFIDIDHFKGVNDALGHAAADDLLRDVAHFLRGLLRADDMLARVGGDEFAVLLTELDESEALRIMRRINAAAHGHIFVGGGQSFSLTLSIGLVHASPGSHSVSSLLATSDTACRVAKEAGRDRVQLYDLSDPRVHVTQQRMSWAERVRLALEHDRFELHLQAIVDAERSVLGYEALLRMRDENGVYCSPAHFLPAARRLGLMGRIDLWVCRQAIAVATQLLARDRQQYVSVNIGAGTLADPAFQRNFVGMLDMTAGIEHALRVEITETEEIDDLQHTVAFLDVLRQRGLKLYLDDFGHGYNSFEALKQLPVDGIKIDWTVTRDMMDDPINEALIKAAIFISQSLGLELVAEGVEREAQLDKLRSLGAVIYQGFLFHRPEAARRALAGAG